MAKNYTQVRRVKDPSFNIDELHNYTLSLVIGTRDFQLCVINQGSKVLLIEDFKLNQVKTVNQRLETLSDIFENHHLLQAGFWKAIRLGLKTHKYTLVPESQFVPENTKDYLSVHCEIHPKIEEVLYHKHIGTDMVNVFAADAKLIKWIKSLYPKKDVSISHHGSALIEGIIKHDDHSHEKTMFCYFDRGVLHAIVTESKQLLYYNQFGIKQQEDYLKYIMLVFKELSLSQKNSKIIVWGHIRSNSKHVTYLNKYIKNISYGSRPSYLNYAFQFDEIPDHQYFDVMNTYLCE